VDVLTLPDLGEGLQRAEIVNWHVAVGEHVVTNQPLVAVETDKAVVDVPSPRSGTIAKLCAEVGDVVEVGAPLVEFSGEERRDSGTVVGRLETPPQPVESPRPPQAPGYSAADNTGVVVSPRIRALARELNVDLRSVEGTGPGGAIQACDVERFAGNGAGAGDSLRGVRRAMAERMAAAHAQVVPATLHDDADVDAWTADTDITWRLIRAIVTAAAAEPALNAWFDADAMTRRVHEQVDLGIAVDTDEGLFVPVLRNVGQRGRDSVLEGLQRIKADVVARSIPPQELRGQTITLSNFGSIGGRYAELVVVPPQVAIIGAGRISSRVVPVSNGIAVRRHLPLSVSFDHRCLTGAEVARFLVALIGDLQLSD
jgi:pyruvate dehydrogenase E2 component (dihydrolipoamide acetyltransferase)